MDNHDLKNAGLKVTLPRLKILKILEQATPRHISAEDIYKALIESGDDVGLATVYRVLTQFEQASLVIRHTFTDGCALFELDEGEHHDHLVCTKCGLVEEFLDDVIENRQSKIADDYGFQITDHSMTLFGLCPKCQTVDHT